MSAGQSCSRSPRWVLLPGPLEMSAGSISEPALATYSEASLLCFLQHPRSGQRAGSSPSPLPFCSPSDAVAQPRCSAGAAGQAATSRICRTLLFVVVEALSSSSCFVFSPLLKSSCRCHQLFVGISQHLVLALSECISSLLLCSETNSWVPVGCVAPLTAAAGARTRAVCFHFLISPLSARRFADPCL